MCASSLFSEQEKVLTKIGQADFFTKNVNINLRYLHIIRSSFVFLYEHVAYSDTCCKNLNLLTLIFPSKKVRQYIQLLRWFTLKSLKCAEIIFLKVFYHLETERDYQHIFFPFNIKS